MTTALTAPRRAGGALTDPHPIPPPDTSTLVRLLRGVERLPEGSTGALVFGTNDFSAGTLLVERNRVCWGAAEGMETRLTDILVTQSQQSISTEVVEATYEACRVEGTPLGAALVAKGIVTAAGLKQALRLHIGEAVSRLSHALAAAGSGWSPQWRPSRGRRYGAQFTFTPIEILVCAGSLSEPSDARLAHGRLEPMSTDGTVMAAFPNTRAGTLPIAQLNCETVPVDDLIGLGAWARGSLRSLGSPDGEPLVASMSAEGRTAAAWVEGGICYAAKCDNLRSLAVLIARRRRSGA